MGVLLRVLRWCTLGAARTWRGAVVSFEVDGDPTLGAGKVGTLCGGPSCRLMVSSRSILVCLNFSFVEINKLASNTFNKSAAARSVLSDWEIVGIRQCVG